MKSAVLGRPFHIRFGGATDFQYVADTAAAFIACADNTPEGAHVFNLHGETVTVNASRISSMKFTEWRLDHFWWSTDSDRGRDGRHCHQAVGWRLPSTPLEAGVRETMERFAALRDAGRLDTSDIDFTVNA